MINITSFTFNPFQENTYVIYDETKECAIIDPGCYIAEERKILTNFIEQNGLKPVKLLNTHSHIDHILGNHFVADKYKLELEMHELDLAGLRATVVYGSTWGINVDPSPEPSVFLKDGDTVHFGSSSLEVLFTPGHSAGSITFYNKEDKFAIVGDVLFLQSIGRTDLPGGDFNTLISSIKQKLFPLGDDVKIYSGHGPFTTIGFEKVNNPFL